MITRAQKKAIVKRLSGRKSLPANIQRLKNRHPHDSRKILEMRAENEKGELPAYAWPGGYPIFYDIAEDNRYHRNEGVACPDCVNDGGHLGSDDGVQGYDVNWEDPDLYCDVCGKRIESAYAEDRENADEDEE